MLDNYTKENLQKVAEEEGIELSSKADKVIKLVIRSEGYCPCKPDHKGEQDYLCPCKFHLDQIKEQGHCCCNLFVAKESK